MKRKRETGLSGPSLDNGQAACCNTNDSETPSTLKKRGAEALHHMLVPRLGAGQAERLGTG